MDNIKSLFSSYLEYGDNSEDICREFIINFIESYIIEAEAIGVGFRGSEFDSIVSTYYGLSKDIVKRVRLFRNALIHGDYYRYDIHTSSYYWDFNEVLSTVEVLLDILN